MIRRSFIDKYNLKYQEGYLGMQDYKFFVDSSKIGNISSISNLLLLYRVHWANETTRRMVDYKDERKRKYDEIQEYSLKASGYNLSEKQMYIIHKVLSETDGKCDDKEELQLLYETFQEIISQTQKMDADYCTELELVCKGKLLGQIAKLIKF
jgi:hypothetical protein